MIELTIKTEIARPAAEVFAYVTDPAKLPSWQTNTVSAVQEGEGPLRVGTRLREVHRGPGGKELASLVEVSELEPDRIFALRMLEGLLRIHGRIVLDPVGERRTRMRFTVQGSRAGRCASLSRCCASRSGASSPRTARCSSACSKADGQAPNQRARRLEPNSRFSSTSASDGSWNTPAGLGPEKKSTSTRPTRPAPNSIQQEPRPS
jgi:uncharacterized protein YndB with AHSA1/START domain